jgi:hypothetical protein
MPDDAENLPPALRGDLPRTRSENFVLIYANWGQAAMSPWDITLAFAQAVQAEPEQTMILEKAHVAMTPQFAKALVSTLAGAVKEYERQNGEIQMPETIKRTSEERARIRASASPSVSPSASASPSPESPEE